MKLPARPSRRSLLVRPIEGLEPRRLMAGTATLKGRVIADANADGERNFGETGQAAFAVYADLNLNGKYDAGDQLTTTDATGQFTFDQLPAGQNLSVFPLPQSGFLNTGTGGLGTTSPAAGSVYDEGDLFYVTGKSYLTGQVYADRNGDGKYGSGDDSLAGQIVYLDANNNGQRDSSEQFVPTNWYGGYQLGGLAAGTYQVRLDPSADLGAVLSAPGPVTVGSTLARVPVSPISVVAPAGPGVSVYLVDGARDRLIASTYTNEGGGFSLEGYNSSGIKGTVQWDTDYTPGNAFSADVIGKSIVYLAGSRDSGTPAFVASRFVDENGVAGPVHVTLVQIINTPPVATFGGNDGYADHGAFVTFSNAHDNSAADQAAGFKYSYDVDNDGVFDVVNTTSNSARLPVALGSTPGTYTVRGRITDKDGGYSEYTTQVTVKPAPGNTVSGYTFDDANGNGVQDNGETFGAGKTVYLDANDNNKLDGGETRVITGDDGGFEFLNLPAGTYHVRRVFPSGYQQSTPSIDLTIGSGQGVAGLLIGSSPVRPPTSGTDRLSGYAFDDTNKNGALDSGEVKTGGKVVYLDANNNGKLDTGETSTKTASDGSWSFTGLGAGTYHVRRVFPTGYTYSTTLIDVTFGPGGGAAVGGLQIGSKSTAGSTPTTGVLDGTLFTDNNANGKYDSGDRGTVVARVFLDSNNNGILDSGEISTETNTVGHFAFTGLASGTYHVRRVFNAGQSYSTPLIDVTLAAGQTKSGLLIGTKKG